MSSRSLRSPLIFSNVMCNVGLDDSSKRDSGSARNPKCFENRSMRKDLKLMFDKLDVDGDHEISMIF